MEQLKYSSKMYVDNPQIKIKPCRMAATNSPTTAHLSPLPTEHRDKSTKTQTHTHTARGNSQLTAPGVTFLSKVWHYKTVVEAMDFVSQSFKFRAHFCSSLAMSFGAN